MKPHLLGFPKIRERLDRTAFACLWPSKRTERDTFARHSEALIRNTWRGRKPWLLIPRAIRESAYGCGLRGETGRKLSRAMNSGSRSLARSGRTTVFGILSRRTTWRCMEARKRRRCRCGHDSTDMLFRHYRELVTKDETDKF